MKIKNKIIIIIAIIVLIVGIRLFNNSNTPVDKSNVQIDKNIEGDYTGYQLTLTTSYGGYGVFGQDLGSGTIIKTYNISNNDIFYENLRGDLEA